MDEAALPHLLRAKDLIDARYGEPLDVTALAREACCSRAHFIRAFRAAFGETPHQYRMRRRVERAQELLRSTDLSVTEISLEVGFRSLGSFSSQFRAIAGESPSAYRSRAEPAPVPACFTLMFGRPVGRA